MKAILALFFNIYRNKRLLLVFIFLVSIFVSSIFLLLLRNVGPPQHRIPGTDYISIYKPTAENILGGKGVTIGGKLVTEVPPGYPMILSMIFGTSRLLRINELKLIVIFNTIVSALTCVVLFLIAELIFNKKIGLITAFLWMSYPFNLWFIKNPNTEVPFIFLLYLGIFLYISSLKRGSWKCIFLAGIFLGFASLIRPTSFLASFLLALLIIFFAQNFSKREKYFLAVVLLMGNILIILPWEIHVLLQTGKLIPLSTLGPGAVKAGFTFDLKPGAGGDVAVFPNDARALMERAEAADLGTSAKIFRFCMTELIQKPIPFLKLLGLKMTRAWYATSQKWYESQILAVQIPYLVTAFLGLVFGAKIYRKRVWSIILLLGIIFYFWIVAVVAHSILRYMVPIMGLVIIFSAIAVNIIINKFTKKRPPCRS